MRLPAVLDIPGKAAHAVIELLLAALIANLQCIRMTAAIDTEGGLHIALVGARALRVRPHQGVA